MSLTTPATEPVEPEVTSLDQVDENMRRHAEIQKELDRQTARNAAADKRRNERRAEKRRPLQQEQKRIEQVNKVYLKKNRLKLIREHGKVITLKYGVVAFRIIGRYLVTPRDVKPVVSYLERRRGGTRYLTPPVRELDREALAASHSWSLWRSLRSFGVKRARREDLTMKPNGYEKPIVLDKRLIGVPRRTARKATSPRKRKND